jgi:holliday junction DNA helicase RuvB
MQLGFVLRTPRGRMLAEMGYRHVGLAVPKGARAQLDLLDKDGGESGGSDA